MKKIVVPEPGLPEQMQLETDLDRPAPGPEQVLLEAEALGVNFRDVNERKGASPVRWPFTPGFEGVGRIIARGEGCTTLAVGQPSGHGQAVSHALSLTP